MLLVGRLAGIVHRAKENNICHTGEYHGQKQQYYRGFMRSPIVILDLFLFFCSCKLVAYAVQRTDNLHVILVVLAFPLMVLSISAFM